MIARMAAAMQAESAGKPFTWENAARAALMTLREPTPEMLEAVRAIGGPQWYANARATWPTMIDAALAEKLEG